MVKSYQVDKEINGVKYVAQFCGISNWLNCVDKSILETGQTSTKLLAENVLKMGLVEPKDADIDDFETQEELQEVTNFISGVMRGHFREKTAEKSVKK
nr:MAG TPA: hypothetical protein [Caudoviricetes sp.]